MLPNSEKTKGINYNITFSENSIEKKAPLNTESVALISYLNEKIRFLESENSQLKKEITFKCKDKEIKIIATLISCFSQNESFITQSHDAFAHL